MNSEIPSGQSQDSLAIELSSSRLPVSHVSSLLRVIQAALREVALSSEDTRRQFDRRPQPILLLTSASSDSTLTLLLTFAGPRESAALDEFSSQVFDAFLDQFGGFVRRLPQPGLWGGAARGQPKREFESALTQRMDQVHRELRRSKKATLRFRGRTIEVEGERMDIA
jgi:hypothetical protein